VLQGAAADCNSAGETHAWFDSRVAHHFPLFSNKVKVVALCPRAGAIQKSKLEHTAEWRMSLFFPDWENARISKSAQMMRRAGLANAA
jgi:hypothetical protein